MPKVQKGGSSTKSHTNTSTKADTRGNSTSTITLGGPYSRGATTINIGGKRKGGSLTPKAKRVIKRMAPINGVLGNSALPQTGGKIGRIPKDRVHNAAHPGFKAIAKRMSLKEGVPIEEANAMLAASTRRRMGGDVLNKLPIQSFSVTNKGARERSASVTDPRDLKMDPKLRDGIAQEQGNSPLDLKNREHVGMPTIRAHNKRLVGLHKARRMTIKGGRTYCSLKNLTVHPE